MANTPALASKRSVSVDRRRSVAARPLIPDFDPKNGGVSAATKLLVTSTRSLSVSFQGEAFSLAYYVEESSTLSGSGNAVRSLQNSMIDERRSSLGGRASLDLGHSELSNVAQQSPYGNSVNNEALMPCDLTMSDSDSVSSGSTSGVQECGPGSQRKNGPRGIFASAKFWQETNSRLRRLQDPGSPLSTSPGSKLIVPPKLKKYSELKRSCMYKKRSAEHVLAVMVYMSCLMTFLEDWASLDENHLISVVGAIEALKASTLRLPVGGGATADIRSLEKAIGSAVEVMQAMSNSAYLLLPTVIPSTQYSYVVEEVSCLVSELAKVMKKERALLEQCTDYISLLEAMQVKETFRPSGGSIRGDRDRPDD
ncbi:hypothetical protein SASPL_132014 [Salvia splendens]|uniref:QWRF family n=1 Tax=Salvia splendens TaxID=180675 RepID=A0A8X8ZLE7_SALSN|nr:hypothetical protein SASPL_132014 [Salvia splendens]